MLLWLRARNHLPQVRKKELISACNQKLKIIFFTILIIMAIIAGGFYFVQNSGLLAGGEIALSKLIWLAFAILFWFFIPFLFLIDNRTPVVWQYIFRIFLFNMLLRAIIELYMMYVSNNWNPYYGIVHNVFTITLLIYLVFSSPQNLSSNILFGYAMTLLMMFGVEILFVFYMIFNVTESNTVVYFVPGNDNHFNIIMLTWLVVTLLSIYLLFFSRRWLRGGFIRTGS